MGVLLSACSSTSESPSVTITPGGTVQATGPVSFAATARDTDGLVSWTLSGPGSLSASSGPLVVYRPPAAPGASASATLTARSGSASASVQLSIGPAVLTPARIASLTAPVTVLYDAWDVPHIRCGAAVDCYAVQGWLHARDRLFQMDFLRRVAVGRLAELVGSLGLSQDVQLRTLFTTRAGERLGAALERNLDASARPAITAYVAGINAYLAALRAGTAGPLPGEYAQLPYPISAADIDDWTVADVLSFVRLQQFQLSETLFSETDNGTFAQVFGPGGTHQDLGKLNTWIRAAQPAGERAHTLAQPDIVPAPVVPVAGRQPRLPAGWGPGLEAVHARLGAVRELLRPLDGSFGSNNWVVDAAHSASGFAMVANDPHLSLQYPPNFYLATLTSTAPADNMDITGGAFPGTPGAQVGRGKHVGWGVTVVGYDVTDLYLEQAVPGGTAGCPGPVPLCVIFRGAPVPLVFRPQTYKLRVGPGTAGLVDAVSAGALTATQATVVVVPHHGPLVQAPDATGKAVSARWTGHEDWTQDLKGFLGLNTALDVAGAMAALDDYATGAQNFVLADDGGHIGYYPHALIPQRPWAGTAPNGIPLIPWFPLPGDGSAEWGPAVAPSPPCDAAGTTVPSAACWIPKAQLPQATGSAKGYLATANADPLGVSDDNNPLAHPPYLSFDWDDSTGFRQARITERLHALTTTGAGKVSLADMEALQADHVSRIGAHFTEYVASLPADVPPHTDFEDARTLLQAWKADGYDCPTGLTGIDPASAPDTTAKVATDSAACLLFHTFLRSLLHTVFADDLAVAKLGVGGVQAVKGMLHMLEASTPAGDQAFCNDVDASGNLKAAHSCTDQVKSALAGAWDLLLASRGPQLGGGWLWGKVHTFQPVSQFPLVTVGYEPGPYARPGGAFTVDVGNPSLTGAGPSFAFGSSGNVRHISVMDPSPATAKVRMQLPGPERDVPAGQVGGPDLLGDWARNRYFDLAHGAQIDATAAASQRFAP